MAPSYKNADSTILALIEALILNYVQQVPTFYNTNNNLSLPEPMIWHAIKIMLQYNTIQYKFYCQLPMVAFQRQVLIVQVIKKRKKKVSQIDYQ